jgi:crotonobetainyl-CoA:carnitine CoA-transferase CaiB-like acyl-CoA transferase
MESLGTDSAGASESRSGFALRVDTSAIVTKVANAREAWALPCGAIVGDPHGGLTFTDAVAAVLESRSTGGWQEMQAPAGELWTIIILNS